MGFLTNLTKPMKDASPQPKKRKARRSFALEQEIANLSSKSKRPARKQSSSTSKTTTTTNDRMMYGDTVIGLWWSIVVPIHGWDYYNLDPNDPTLPGARIVYPALVAACLFSVASWWTKRLLFSRLAFAANVTAMSVTNLYDFPFPGECAITEMMLGGTVLGVMANISLPFVDKIMRLPVYFAAGSYVCIHSPYCSYADDTLPTLGTAVLVEMMVLTFVNRGGVTSSLKFLSGFMKVDNWNVANLARMVLAGLFLHHLGSTLYQLSQTASGNAAKIPAIPTIIEYRWYSPDFIGPALEGIGYPFETVVEAVVGEGDKGSIPMTFLVMLKAAVLAVVGVAATGAFQDEINSKERAEQKAKEESMMSKAMADSMVCLTHELRTPLQGIMGATSMLIDENEENDNEGGTDNESLKLIMASSSLLLNLINNMLDVKRVTEGMMEEFPLTLFPAADPIRDAIGFCLPLASISNVVINVDYGPPSSSTEEAVVKSNALRLQQVLINLISNAIKYTNNDSGVSSGASRDSASRDSSSDDEDELESVIRISLRSTTIEDVNWRMMRSLASSRSANADESGDNATKKARFDRWAEKKGDEKVLLFGVSDCGPGIEQHQAGKLFRKFGRLDNKPKRTLGGTKGVGQPSGTGLGLHLCQLFVQKMDGQIWATNNGKNQPGATFFFSLPLGLEKPTPSPEQEKTLALAEKAKRRRSRKKSIVEKQKRNWSILNRRNSAQAAADDDEDGQAPIDDSTRTSNVPSLITIDDSTTVTDMSLLTQTISVFQRRILVVDDTLINRKILNRMLKKIGCQKIKMVGSGAEALKELYKHRYDLVISDLQMPGMSGTELSENIHAIPSKDEYFHLPVVVGLTADTTAETIEKCKASGMADVIHKPICVEDLRDFFDGRISYLVEQNCSGYLEA